jgi:glutamate racemase
MRILFDKNVPYPPRRHLSPNSVQFAEDLGWDLISNGQLLSAAETSGFDLMVTADQNIRYQQNLSTRKIALVVLGSNHWTFLRKHLPEIAAAVNDAQPGSYAFIEVPLPPKPKYQRNS